MRKKRWGWEVWLMVAAALTVASGQAMKSADAALLVHDENNILQNTKTAIHTATTAANTARQVALEIKNLASMSAEGLVAHYLGISEDLEKIVEIAREYKGLLNQAETAKDSWKQSFEDIDDLLDGKTSALKYHTARQDSLRALERTYKDSVIAARAVGDVQKRAKALEEAVLRSSEAIGIKEAVQADSQISALQAAETVKTNEALSQLAAITAARYAKENQEEASAIAINQASADELHEHVLKIKGEETEGQAWRKMYPPELHKFYAE